MTVHTLTLDQRRNLGASKMQQGRHMHVVGSLQPSNTSKSNLYTLGTTNPAAQTTIMTHQDDVVELLSVHSNGIDERSIPLVLAHFRHLFGPQRLLRRLRLRALVVLHVLHHFLEDGPLDPRHGKGIHII